MLISRTTWCCWILVVAAHPLVLGEYVQARGVGLISSEVTDATSVWAVKTFAAGVTKQFLKHDHQIMNFKIW